MSVRLTVAAVHTTNARFDQAGAVALAAAGKRESHMARGVVRLTEVRQGYGASAEALRRRKPDATSSGVPTDGVAHQVSELLIGHRSAEASRYEDTST